MPITEVSVLLQLGLSMSLRPREFSLKKTVSVWIGFSSFVWDSHYMTSRHSIQNL